MSGVIGTSPNMNSGLVGTWPTGHVLQTQSMVSSLANGTSTTEVPAANAGMVLGYVEIVPLQTGSIFILSATWSCNFSRVASYQCAQTWLGVQVSSGYSVGSSGAIFAWGLEKYEGAGQNGDDIYTAPAHTVRHVPSYTLGQTVSYEMRLGANRGTGSVAYPTVMVRDNSNNPASQLIVQEIAG